MKDKSKGNVASNYRPITCLPLIWKLLTGIIADGMYSFLESRDLLPDEQKGCRKKSRGTHDQLFIDKMLMKEVKQRKKILPWHGLTTKRPTTWSHIHGWRSVWKYLELLTT